ncbi:dGTPase [Dyella sp. S184]|uniref:dGTPase n=1 Tax=Dyella sp. S184 TaxID=1641862 RepID=UPI00131E314C|nr:dGTPase [Dyella sp. S184]
MDENYKKILVSKRFRSSSRGNKGILQESESDRARVLYSAAFRRLQRKTQVFPLEENAAIRSRLTHSLEVAHVGRFLATSFIKKVINTSDNRSAKKLGIDGEVSLAIPNIVETACLLHDIGNPPFGHFGESAIANWFKGYWSRCDKGIKSEVKSLELEKDLAAFDGNPQGFRIITKLSGVDDHGMNLLLPQIASTVKYPINPGGIDKSVPLEKKAGLYYTEAGLWDRICDDLGMNKGQRFPLAYMMEAADDISYCLSDIEDGIEKGFFSHKDFVREVLLGVKGNKKAKSLVIDARDSASRSKSFVEENVSFRAKLVNYLVNEVSSVYIKKHAEIFSGELPGLIEACPVAGALLDAIKKAVFKLLYGRRSSVELELTGLAAINGILRNYEALLDLEFKDFEKIVRGRRCERHLDAEVKMFSLLAKKHVAAYERSRDLEGERLARVRLVVDFVAGMTDVFALRTYQIFSGIRV